MLKSGVVRTREHEMSEPKLFDVMKTLYLWGFKQVNQASSDFYITMNRVSDDLMILNHVFSRAETEKELK
jgi:hypothetical protein